VIGLLDITKVFHESLEKLERAYGSSQKLYNAIEGVQSEFGSGGRGTTPGAVNPLMAYVEALRNKMSFPDLGSILDARTSAATVGVKTSVKEAAVLMREHHTTAVCVMESDGRRIAGIFTSKDIVLRVIAAGLDARTCSVVRVMTPHPDTALPSLSIQEALRKMHGMQLHPLYLFSLSLFKEHDGLKEIHIVSYTQMVIISIYPLSTRQDNSKDV
jgi:CBS domain-containing protein